MEEGIVKIGDYGLAKLITPSQGTEHSESIGTCHYMAPEIGSGKYHKPIDIYAMGVILYEMLTGRVPFEGETVNEVLMKHLTARPNISVLPQPYQVDRRQGARQGSQPPDRQSVRPAFTRGCAADSGRPNHRRRQGGSRRRELARRWCRPVEPVRTTSSGSRPRSRSSTSARTRARRGHGRNLIARANCGPTGRPCGVLPVTDRHHRPRAQSAGIASQASPPRNGVLARPPTRAAIPQPAGQASSCTPTAGAAPLASGRVRTAELASSMLWAAPLLALLTVPAAALLGIDLSGDPQQLALLYGMALLGTWTTLVPNKLIEARKARRYQPATDRPGCRIVAWRQSVSLWDACCDSTLSLRRRFSITHATWVRSISELCTPSWGDGHRWRSATESHGSASCRSWRRRLVAAALMPFWPYTRQDGIAIAVLIATAVQVVSPWNEAASLYARYVRASEKQRRKGQVA